MRSQFAALRVPVIANKLKLVTLTVTAIFTFSLTIPVAYADDLTATPTTNQDKTVSSSEIASALRADDGLLAASDQTKTTSDSDSAIRLPQPELRLTYPKTPVTA